MPYKFHLHQNYPNPFYSSTQINYEISTDALVEIVVYNILGERHATLVNAYKTHGNYSVIFD